MLVINKNDLETIDVNVQQNINDIQELRSEIDKLKVINEELIFKITILKRDIKQYNSRYHDNNNNDWI